MAAKIKYGKIVVIVFITVLIWVWADLALDEKLPVSSATISVAKSTNPNLWVSFDGEAAVSIDKIVLRGSASRIADVKRRLNDGSLKLEFFLDAEQEEMTAARQYTLTVLDFLRRSNQIRQLGLKVESCEPDTFSVNVVGLIKKMLEVKCVDDGQNLVKVETVEPAQVEMFVPSDWRGEKLVAKVLLSRREIEQARLMAVKKTPFIELAAGQTRGVPTAVRITTPSEEDPRSDYTITAATLGITSSPTLQGRYIVEVANLDAIINAIMVRASPQAKRAYDKMRYQVILEIDDSDKDAESAEPLRRELIYNFPAEYVRRDEIMLNQQPVTARFKLIPLPSPLRPGAATD